MMEEGINEVAVIGAGMFGSSVAKYLAEDDGNTSHIVLIGPDQPFKGIHGAWFDEGRIAEKLDYDYNWRVLAERAIDRYRDIEKASGINFYSEVGFLTIGPNEEEIEGVRCHQVKEFQPLQWPSNCKAILQPSEAGHISPRLFVQAQKKLAASHKNCHILDDVLVSKIEKKDDLFLLHLEGNDPKTDPTIVQAKKVVLAPGAYVNIKSLIKDIIKDEDVEPDLKLTTQTVAYLEVSPNEAQRLAKMPSVVTKYDYQLLDGTYILPPIQYPDGKYYLKLGHHDFFESSIDNPEQMRKWYESKTGNQQAVQQLAAFITEHFIPDLEVLSVHGGCCVTSSTPMKKAPYIDEIVPGLILAAGGCGYAAKCCDEIGRIAAKLCMTGEWTNPDIPREDAKITWRKVSK